MKLRLILVLLVVMAASSTPAKVRKVKKQAEAPKTEVAKVDTVNRQDFSYAMGVAQVAGLKAYLGQQLKVDTVNNMADFMRGVQDVFNKPKDAKLQAYSAGLQVGQQVLTQFIASINQQITGDPNKDYVSVEDYKRGFIAGISGQGLTMPADSAKNVANRQMQYYHAQLMETKYGENRRAGEAFLAENAKKDSVKTLPSGVQYKILKQGDGPKPTATSSVKVNYEGKTIDGKVFDSSYKRNQPMTFKCNQVIKGWSEAIQQMPVGSTWEIYIPQELGYGAREAGSIKPYSCLIFKVELLGIEADKTPAK